MSFDEQFRPAIDNLTARLRRDIERHLDAALEELTTGAEKVAASTEAERASALQHASQTAWAEGERFAAERFAAERADAEQNAIARLASEREQMEQATEARLAVERAEMERLTLDRLEAERAEVERATVARLRAEREDAERLTLDRLTAERFESERAMIAERFAAERALTERYGAEKADEERAAAERLTAAVEAAEARRASKLRAQEVAAGERLVHALRNMDLAQSLSDILETLASAAAVEARRVAIFLAGGEQFNTWRLHGFEAAVPIGDTLTLTADTAGLIADAASMREPLTGGRDTDRPSPPFASLPADRLGVAVPLIVNDEVVVVLYADEGPGGEIDRASWYSTVEVLARHASRALEAITAHRLARTLSDRAGVRPRPAPRPMPSPASVTMPSLVAAAAPPRQAAVPAAPAPLVVEDEHLAAQRFARQLVSEIRTANEHEVFAGLRERNLMMRLGGEIARAWGQYEARVPEAIRANTNYFHAEMVKTLADGDASLLSPNP